AEREASEAPAEELPARDSGRGASLLRRCAGGVSQGAGRVLEVARGEVGRRLADDDAGSRATEARDDYRRRVRSTTYSERASRPRSRKRGSSSRTSFCSSRWISQLAPKSCSTSRRGTQNGGPLIRRSS